MVLKEPTYKLRKPQPGLWRGPGCADPKYNWVWEDLLLAFPMWEGAGTPVAYGPYGLYEAEPMEDDTGFSWNVNLGETSDRVGPQPRVDTGQLRYDMANSLNGDVAMSIFVANYIKGEGDKHFRVFVNRDNFARGSVVLEVNAVNDDWRFLQVDSANNNQQNAVFTFGGSRSVGGAGVMVINGAIDSYPTGLAQPITTWGTNLCFGSGETDSGDAVTGPLPTAFYIWNTSKTDRQLMMLHDDPWGPFRNIVGEQVISKAPAVGGGGTILPFVASYQYQMMGSA